MTASEADTNSGISAPLSRAARIIDVVAAAAPNGLPLHRIAEEALLPTSTTHRLLRSLVSIGYLDVDDGRRTYRLGRRLARALHAAFGSSSIQAVAEPILSKLVEEFGQVFYLNQQVADRARLLAFILPTAAQRALVVPGEYAPMHATAAGKAILAYQDSAAIERHLSTPLEKYQPATLIDPAAVREDLALVRERGYAISRSEYEAGVTALAVPVFAKDIGVTYAIGTAGIEKTIFEHHKLDDYVEAMSEAARDLEAHLSPGALDRSTARLSRLTSFPAHNS